jgi:hypothetical protein
MVTCAKRATYVAGVAKFFQFGIITVGETARNRGFALFLSAPNISL